MINWKFFVYKPANIIVLPCPKIPQKFSWLLFMYFLEISKIPYTATQKKSNWLQWKEADLTSSQWLEYAYTCLIWVPVTLIPPSLPTSPPSRCLCSTHNLKAVIYFEQISLLPEQIGFWKLAEWKVTMKTTIYVLRYFGRNTKNTAKNGSKSIELIYLKNRAK
jgi:hypothetical protein